MRIISKFALIAAIAAVGIASPALAQSAGNGNVSGFSHALSPAQSGESAVRQSNQAKTAARQNGQHAFASVPGASSNSSSNDPAFTGGGSAGYNESLKQY